MQHVREFTNVRNGANMYKRLNYTDGWIFNYLIRVWFGFYWATDRFVLTATWSCS